MAGLPGQPLVECVRQEACDALAVWSYGLVHRQPHAATWAADVQNLAPTAASGHCSPCTDTIGTAQQEVESTLTMLQTIQPSVSVSAWAPRRAPSHVPSADQR
ncbi:hypothetical protein GCM10010319_24060 [Streptomyces blastmyceticus]|uniref:Uncharacterized protein n=1 Tax=Streptomyces blastmyceticus TaxID=68180 RepID=A0ABN0WUA7_9ACTN